MDLQYTPWIFPLFLSTGISIGLALYTWKRRATVGAVSFTILMLAVAEWSLVYVFRLVSVNLAAKIFWAKLRYLGIVITPTAWLIFVLEYTGQDRWLGRRSIIALSIEPLVTLLLTWTNEYHHLIWRDIELVYSGSLALWEATYGWWHGFHAVYVYLLLVVSALLLVRIVVRSPRLLQGQAIALLVSVLIPFAGDLMSSYGLTSFPLDLTPFAFTMAGLAAAWGISRFRLFDVVLAARGAVVENMDDGVVVLDLQDGIVDLNPSAQDIIGQKVSEVIGRSFSHIFPGTSELIERYSDTSEAQVEITLGEGSAQRHYDLHISPLYNTRRHLVGRLILLRDVTERKQTEADLVAQKQLFESLVAIARATTKRTSLKDTLQSALNMAAALTEAEHGSIFLLNGAGLVTHSVLTREQIPPTQRQSLVESVMEKGLSGWVFRHRQPALIPDTSRDNRWLQLPDTPFDVASALSIPIVSGSAVLGVLTLTHSEPHHFTPEHAYLIQSSTDQITMALRNAQMYDEQRRLAVRQTTLYETLRTAGEHLDAEAITHTAVEAIARLTGWPSVAILLPDERERDLEVQGRAGVLASVGPNCIPIDEGVAGRAFQTGQKQYVPDISPDLEGQGDVGPVCRSELAVPLRRGERVLGILDISSDQPTTFDSEEILLATYLAEAIALALDNARLYTEISQYAAGLSTLYTIARSISRSLMLENVLSETLNSALTSLNFDAGLVSLVNPNDDDGRLHLAVEQGFPAKMSDQVRRESFNEILKNYVCEESRTVSIGDIEQETPLMRQIEEKAPNTIEDMKALGMRSFSCIPLLHRERSIGVLSLFSRQPRALSPEDDALQTAIGQQIATAVTNARLFQAVADERSRLQALIESSRDGIVLIGMDQRILVVNAPALHLLRLNGLPKAWINRPAQDAINVLELSASKAAQVIRDELHRVQTGDTSPGEGECEVSPHTIHWLNLPVMAGATPLGRLLVLHDVTEERLLERMREDLVHAMVHDLRNPLTAIHGALSFLNDNLDAELSSTQQQLWDIAQSNTQGMLRLVNAILEISRLENKQMPLDHTMVTLADLISNVLGLQLPLANEKNIQLESDIPSTLPPVWADATLIERVLKNLIGNAIKFTPEGGTVRVTAKPKSEDPTKLLVSVIDTGSGIPPEIRDRLFRKFVTGEQQGRGSGLGLAFCKMVVEAHGERIWVEETSKEGSTFTFSLPVPQASEPGGA